MEKQFLIQGNIKAIYLFMMIQFLNGVYVPTFIINGEVWPPNTKEWYNGEVDGFKVIGQGEDGLDDSWPGDICVIFKRDLFFQPYEHLIGFIYIPGKTISAASDGIILNDWGWRKEEYYYNQYLEHQTGVNKNVRIYIYHP